MPWGGRRNRSGLKGRLLYLLALVCGLFACPPGLASAETPSNTFLVVSDIHFNPMADPSLAGDLVAADPTQWETILERSRLTRFSQYGEDTNWWLLRSALDQMRLTLPRPTFIMVPGDFLAHDFPANYAAVTHDNESLQDRLPLRGIGWGNIGDQGRVCHWIEVNV